MSYSEQQSDREDCSQNYEQLHSFIKLLLKDKVFSGFYKERRLIESLSAYKDIIEVDEQSDDFTKSLNMITETVRKNYNNAVVTGVSREENNRFSIWTNMSDVAFGSYWFMIKNIVIQGNIVTLHVKCLRLININKDSASAPSTAEEPSYTFNTASATEFRNSFMRNVSEVVTRENLILLCRFLSVLILTLSVAVYNLLQLLLKYFHELNNLVKIMIPVFLAMIDGVTKAFGGVLILISMMWNGKSSAPSHSFPTRPPAQLQYQGYSSYSGGNPNQRYRGRYAKF